MRRSFIVRRNLHQLANTTLHRACSEVKTLTGWAINFRRSNFRTPRQFPNYPKLDPSKNFPLYGTSLPLHALVCQVHVRFSRHHTDEIAYSEVSITERFYTWKSVYTTPQNLQNFISNRDAPVKSAKKEGRYQSMQVQKYLSRLPHYGNNGENEREEDYPTSATYSCRCSLLVLFRRCSMVWWSSSIKKTSAAPQFLISVFKSRKRDSVCTL